MKEKKWLKYLTYTNSIVLLTLAILCFVSIISDYYDYSCTPVIDRADLLEILNTLFQFILALGIVLAYIQYITTNNWEKKIGLELGLTIQKKQNLIIFKTTVKNKAKKNIAISNAILILTPHNEDFLKTINRDYHKCYKCTNELKDLKSENATSSNTSFIIDLDYFYSENIRVGNETLVYEKPLLNKEKSIKVWDVRFLVFTKEGLHRSVHSIFKGSVDIINPSSPSANKPKKI